MDNEIKLKLQRLIKAKYVPMKKEEDSLMDEDDDDDDGPFDEDETEGALVMDESMEWDLRAGDDASTFRDGRQEPSVGGRPMSKRERHRYAAAKYRRKEILTKEQLEQNENRLIAENARLQAHINELESIRECCLDELNTVNKDNLHRALNAHAALVPPHIHDQVLGIRQELYRKMARDLKLPMTTVNTQPATSQIASMTTVNTQQATSRIASMTTVNTQPATSQIAPMTTVNTQPDTSQIALDPDQVVPIQRHKRKVDDIDEVVVGASSSSLSSSRLSDTIRKIEASISDGAKATNQISTNPGRTFVSARPVSIVRNRHVAADNKMSSIGPVTVVDLSLTPKKIQPRPIDLSASSSSVGDVRNNRGNTSSTQTSVRQKRKQTLTIRQQLLGSNVPASSSSCGQSAANPQKKMLLTGLGLFKSSGVENAAKLEASTTTSAPRPIVASDKPASELIQRVARSIRERTSQDVRFPSENTPVSTPIERIPSQTTATDRLPSQTTPVSATDRPMRRQQAAMPSTATLPPYQTFKLLLAADKLSSQNVRPPLLKIPLSAAAADGSQFPNTSTSGITRPAVNKTLAPVIDRLPVNKTSAIVTDRLPVAKTSELVTERLVNEAFAQVADRLPDDQAPTTAPDRLSIVNAITSISNKHTMTKTLSPDRLPQNKTALSVSDYTPVQNTSTSAADRLPFNKTPTSSAVDRHYTSAKMVHGDRHLLASKYTSPVDLSKPISNGSAQEASLKNQTSPIDLSKLPIDLSKLSSVVEKMPINLSRSSSVVEKMPVDLSKSSIVEHLPISPSHSREDLEDPDEDLSNSSNVGSVNDVSDDEVSDIDDVSSEASSVDSNPIVIWVKPISKPDGAVPSADVSKAHNVMETSKGAGAESADTVAQQSQHSSKQSSTFQQVNQDRDVRMQPRPQFSSPHSKLTPTKLYGSFVKSDDIKSIEDTPGVITLTVDRRPYNNATKSGPHFRAAPSIPRRRDPPAHHEQTQHSSNYVQLKHKSLLNREVDYMCRALLPGETRKDRQRYASAKNRRKNRLMKDALRYDEKQLTDANTELKEIIAELEQAKGSCLAMLTMSNKPLTNKLLSSRNQIPEPLWDTVGVTIAFKVPQPPDVYDFPCPGGRMNIEGKVPCRMLNADASMWPKPNDPHFLRHVRVNVKLEEQEWNSTMLPAEHQEKGGGDEKGSSVVQVGNKH